MRKFMLAAIVALTFAAPQARAFTQFGQGNQSCGWWTEKRNTKQDLGPMSWVTGYLSGVATMVATDTFDMLEGNDAQGLWGWIDNYCRTNPLDKLSAAVDALVATLIRKQVTTTKPAPVVPGKRS
jgi:hypothetical protein